MEQAPTSPKPLRVMAPQRPCLALCLVLILGGCGAGRAPVWDPSAANLPAYTASDAALLDDRLSPEVFGAVVDPSDPVGRRASLADGIVRARLVTVTRDSTGQSESYVLELQPAPPALKGPDIAERLALTIPPANPSFAFVKSSDSELVGRPVIVIYKRYNEGGQATLRWHIEADNPRVMEALDRARIMGELGR